jgi:hypothetical protein
MGRDLTFSTYTKGVPVLRWADEEIACDKQMVLFLVWSNPSNLAYAIAALKADFEIVSKAMKSPYYFETSPAMPEHCILRYADDTIRNDREFVLNHITHCVDPTGKKCSLSYEIQFISANLKNDKTLMAWAGAPHGAIAQMLPDKDFLQFLKDLPLTGISVRYIEDNQKRVFDCHAKYLVNIDIFNGRKICMETHWGKMKESEKIEWCKRMWNSINEKLPLYFRVSPEMREVCDQQLRMPTRMLLMLQMLSYRMLCRRVPWRLRILNALHIRNAPHCAPSSAKTAFGEVKVCLGSKGEVFGKVKVSGWVPR